MIKVSFVAHVPGHKNSSGEVAPWVVKQHETGKILSSHKTKEEAVSHLRDIEGHKKSFVGIKDIDCLIKLAGKYNPGFDDKLFVTDVINDPAEKTIHTYVVTGGEEPVVCGQVGMEFRMILMRDYPIYIKASEYDNFIHSIWEKDIAPLGDEIELNESIHRKVRPLVPEYILEYICTEVHLLTKIFKDLEGKGRSLKLDWNDDGAGTVRVSNVDITFPFITVIKATKLIEDRGYWTEKLL
jgi:hypothetical protein